MLSFILSGLVDGFIWSRLDKFLHALYHHAQYWILWGLMGLKCPVSLHIIHLGIGLFHATNGHTVGHIASSQLCFTSALLVG
jgi:hypothetical protein